MTVYTDGVIIESCMEAYISYTLIMRPLYHVHSSGRIYYGIHDDVIMQSCVEDYMIVMIIVYTDDMSIRYCMEAYMYDTDDVIMQESCMEAYIV